MYYIFEDSKLLVDLLSL